MFGIFENSGVKSKLLSNIVLKLGLLLRETVRQHFIREVGKFINFRYQVSSGCPVLKIINIG